MRTAAVLGASSMLGQALCQRLSKQGTRVVRIGRDLAADIRLDLAETDTEATLATDFRAEVFFHCAASFADDSVQGVAQNLQINSYSAFRVASLAKQLGACQFIYAGSLSSDANFDPVGYNSYGLSKALAEQQFGWLVSGYDALCTTLRFPQLYDTFGRCIRHQPWFGRVVAYAAQGQSLNLPEASALRNFLHVDDAAQMMLKAAEMKVSGLLQALHPEPISMLNMANLAYQIFEQGGQTRIDASKTPFRTLQYPDGKECWQLLDYVPEISLAHTFSKIREQALADRFGPLDVN